MIPIIFSYDFNASAETQYEYWNVKEGMKTPLEWDADWEVPLNGDEFKCTQYNRNHTKDPISADCIVTRSKTRVFIERFNATNGNECKYAGHISNNFASGEYFCGNGGPFKWTATIRQKKED